MRNYKYWPAMAVFLVLTISLHYQGSAAAGPVYVVAAEAALLRDQPSPDSHVLARLGRFDQVEYMESNAHGWWKVRSVRTGVAGWMTSDLLAAASPAPQYASPPKTKYFYVHTPSIDLRVMPLTSSATTGVAQLNDKLEKLGETKYGWTKIRNLRNGNEGWLPTSCLSTHTYTASQAPDAKKWSKKVGSRKKKKSPEPSPEPTGAVEELPNPM